MIAWQRQNPSSSRPASTRADLRVAPRIVRGRDAVLRFQPLLEKISERSGQQGEAENLEHFLTTPAALRKQPCLVLLPASAAAGQISVEGYAGAVLLFEYLAKSLPLGIYASSDWTGRRNVLGPGRDRAALAAWACRSLLEGGANIAFAAFHVSALPASADESVRDALRSRKGGNGCWSLLQREVPLYLPLERTFDATLAGIGQKTRANLRYYRRRAQAQLGCAFVPEARLGLAEFLAFNRVCSFAVPEEVARARYAAIATLRRPFLSGILAGDGRWLSLVLGWYRHNAIEIEWQMNREDMPEYSLSTVMRSFLIDHAIARGCERLYIEGGTQQAIQQSFVKEYACDLTLVRSAAAARLVKRFASRAFPPDNHLGGLLANRALLWEPW